MPPRRLIITGSAGYIGQRLVDMACCEGREVIALARSHRSWPTGVRCVEWELGQALPSNLSGDGACETALIHLAHDWSNKKDLREGQDSYNLVGTKLLVDSARRAGIKKVVFVSSQSARADAPNIYGRTKWKIEQAIGDSNVVSARVGLVYGGPCQGMFGLLNRLVSKLPFLPMVSPGRFVQPIHLDEVCRGLLLLADNAMFGVKGLAGPEPIRFGSVLSVLAREAWGRRLVVLHVPLTWALLAARVTQYIPVIPSVDPERILGLAGTLPMSCVDDVKEMGLDIKSMETGLRQSFYGRYGLLVESKTLLSYVLGQSPSVALIRRYVAAVHAIEVGSGALGLFPLFIAVPWLISFIEPVSRSRPLAHRLSLAAHLVDASSEGACLLSGPQNRTLRLLKLSLWLIRDIVAFPFRLVATAVMR